MTSFAQALTAYFSLFLGIYSLCAGVFFVTYVKTKGKEFFSFMGLSFSLIFYLLGALVFVRSEDPYFNANFIFPLQSLFGSSAFYFYLRSVKERLFITTLVIKVYQALMVVIMISSVAGALLYFNADLSLFESSGKGQGIILWTVLSLPGPKKGSR